MGIKIFFKHLFNSINHRKAQPILLVCVIAVAVVVSISTINLKLFTVENVSKQNFAIYGRSDYVVSCNSLSPRFKFVDDAKEEFGERANICGLFALPTFYGENNDFMHCVATNIYDAGKVFGIELKDYSNKKVPKGCYRIFVSQKVADEYGFQVGDEVMISVLSGEAKFVIQGIAENRFFDTYDTMIDSSSLVKIMSKDSISASMMLGDADIASQIYFDVQSDDVTFFADLKAFYSDMNVTDVSMLVGVSYGLDEIIILMILAIVFFVGCVIFCCCYILATQRVEETDLFYCVGAKSYMLNAISMIELALYWLLGSVMGGALSYPVGQLIIDICGLSYCVNALSAVSVSVSVIIMFFATEGGLLLYLATDWINKRRRKKANNHFTIKPIRKIGSAITIVLWVIIFGISSVVNFIDDDTLWIISLTNFFLFIVALTLTTKHACARLPKICLKNRKLPITTRYALKNIQKTSTLSNLSMLISLLTISLASVALVFSSVYVTMEDCRDLVNGDYMLMYATDSSIQKLKENDKVESVESIFKDMAPLPYSGSGRFDMYAATDLDVFQGLFTLDEMPKENEAYIFGIFADNMGLELGDTFTIDIGEKELTLIYTKRLKVNTNGMVINAEYLGLPYNYTVIKGKEGVSKGELYEEIQSTLALDSALVLDVNQINEGFLESNSFTYYCCLFMLAVIVIYSSIGIIDNIASSYRSRREEFECYSLAGMSKRDLFKMKASELAISVTCGVLLGILTTPIAYAIIFECGLSQGMNIWWILFI